MSHNHLEIGIDLNRRRVNSAVQWIHKILTGRIDCPELRSQLVLNTGERILSVIWNSLESNDQDQTTDGTHRLTVQVGLS